MGYFDSLDRAADWLALVQNKNKGWGMSRGQASSIVNTAEAIYVLTRANRHYSKIDEGLAFIEARLFPAIEKSGPRTRYVVFALLAAFDHVEVVDQNFVKRCVRWLMDARNTDGAWGHDAKDGESRLYPTCFSLLMLTKFGVDVKDLESAFHWLVSKKRTESGWSFEDGKTASPAATAMAILALRIIKDYNEDIFTKPKEYLLETSHWNNERENLPGTLWDHCTYMWVFPALVSLDVNPYAPTIAQGVRFVNGLVDDHGWNEPFGGVTIRSQFWAVYALDCLANAFDPAIHIYRIDSERTQPTLSEPEFVHIKIRGPWAMVVPRKTYRLFTYLILSVSVIAFLGFHRLLSSISRWADFGVAVLFFTLGYVLVRKRRKLFPYRLLWIILGCVVILSFVDLVFGVSVLDLFKKLEIFRWNQTQV